MQKRKAHRDEMLFYLRTLHYTALYENEDAYIDHGLAPDSERLKNFSPVFKARSQNLRPKATD